MFAKTFLEIGVFVTDYELHVTITTAKLFFNCYETIYPTKDSLVTALN